MFPIYSNTDSVFLKKGTTTNSNLSPFCSTARYRSTKKKRLDPTVTSRSKQKVFRMLRAILTQIIVRSYIFTIHMCT